jgi:hypothetical protein
MLCTIVRSRSVAVAAAPVLVPALALALAACGGSSRQANAPMETGQTTTTGAVVDVGNETPYAPSGIGSNGAAAKADSLAPASPMEGACPEGPPRGAARDRTSCIESCRGYDDTVPLGSRCITQYADCTLKCEEKFANPYRAAELGFIDEVIYPRTLRARLHRALEMLKDKRDSNLPKKHTNLPL